ncbi:MAG TPA: GNAT family N-acetyltransferase [Actinopolymorphaceae bacterium]|jgi:predicted acetyltransferase
MNAGERSSGSQDQVTVQLHRVREQHKSVLANLVQFYQYDFTEFRDLKLSPHGTYVYRWLDHYFVEPSRQALFIVADDAIAGFALMRRLPTKVNQVAEFFVLKAHRRKGVGRAAATKLFRRFPGRWQLEFDHTNAPAGRFWPGVVAEVASGPVESRELVPPEVEYPCTQLLFTVDGRT